MPEQSDVGKMPWEMDWNPTVSKVAEAASTALEGVSAAVEAVLPWNMDWGGKRKIDTTPIQPTQPKQQPQESFSFAKIFNNLIQAESGGVHATNGNLTSSPVGAQGITQLMPKTAANPGFGIKPVQDQSEGEYLRVGKEYLNALIKEFNGDTQKAVAAYNWGLGRVKTATRKYGEEWLSKAPVETQKYVKKVLG